MKSINKSVITSVIAVISGLILVMATMYGCSRGGQLNNHITSSPIPLQPTASYSLLTQPSQPTQNTASHLSSANPVDTEDKQLTSSPSASTPNTQRSLNTATTSPHIGSDVAYILKAKFQDPNERQVALAGAALLQQYLDDPSQEALPLLRRYDCTVLPLTQTDQNLIKTLTFNTPERMAILKDGLQNYEPPVSVTIAIDEAGNPISPCQAMLSDTL